MPRGEPTRTVRIPLWLFDQLAHQAGDDPTQVGALITRRLARQPVNGGAPAERCTCPTPKLSKVVTNLCTACGRLR